MNARLPRRAGWVTVVLLGLGSVGWPWLKRWRPPPPAARAPLELRVSSEADDGLGSLREAIARANHEPARVRLLLPPRRIVLRTPLPPLVNPRGIALEGQPGSEIDAAGQEAEAVLDVLAPGSGLRGFSVRGCAGPAVLVRASHVRLESLHVADCQTGVYVTRGVSQLVVAGSSFESNGTGVELEAAREASISDSSFRGHRRAGVWAVSPAPPAGLEAGLVVRHSRFENDAIAIIAMNAAARLEDNHVSGARDFGLFVSGARNELRRNRARGGRAYGIFAVASESSLIEHNEADHNRAVGILLRDALATAVRDNQVYANGYGVVVVFGDDRRPSSVSANNVWQQALDGLYVIGGSPLLTDNQVRANGAAGLRIDDFIAQAGRRYAARPFLRGNVVEGNGVDAPQRGRYAEAAAAPRGRP